VIWIPNSSFQHQSYAVMPLIHKMSSQSQGILNVASNANADPLSKTWGFQVHLAPALCAIYLVQPHRVTAPLGRSNPSIGMQPLAAFPAAYGESGRNGAPQLLLY